ncbi:hypothetical protein AB8A31_15795 [Tardiphaga sp. 804_B3_N1_9]|uniref:hypothetical protein n=1 Tax=Tardiphaga sp. 804_B3_N1_9 TaxID=3240786 RepID=UPI003F20F897
MSSYAWTLRALDHEARESKQAVERQMQRLLDASAEPSDSDIANLADRRAVAAATAALLAIVQPFARTGNSTELLGLFLPIQRPDMLAYTCGVSFRCFPYTGSYLPEPLEKLRSRTDRNAVLARTAAGDLTDWKKAEIAARAVMVLRRLIPASIEARGQK